MLIFKYFNPKPEWYIISTEPFKGLMKCKNACWLVLIYNTLIINNVAKRLFNMCHIFYYNFSVNFLQSTWIHPQKKNLPNQDSCCDITCQSPSSKHYHFKRQGYVGQPGLSALSQWHDTIHLQKKGSEGVFVECYCDKAVSTNYLT